MMSEEKKMCTKCFSVFQGECALLTTDTNGQIESSYICFTCYRELTAPTISTTPPENPTVANRLLDECIAIVDGYGGKPDFDQRDRIRLHETISWAESQLENAEPAPLPEIVLDHIKLDWNESAQYKIRILCDSETFESDTTHHTKKKADTAYQGVLSEIASWSKIHQPKQYDPALVDELIKCTESLAEWAYMTPINGITKVSDLIAKLRKYGHGG